MTTPRQTPAPTEPGPGTPLRIDVILPTYNRADILPRAIDSFLAATLPDHAETHLVVLDNNSTDNTRALVQSYTDRHPTRIHYLFVEPQGVRHALQAATDHSTAEVVARFDDDEELQHDWLQVLARNFADPTLDYLGGEMRPSWLVPRPDWLPPAYTGAVGIVHDGDQRRQYGSPGFSAMPVGGNCAFRRNALARCRPWTDSTLPYAEDRFIYHELERIGAIGVYDPALVVLHQVPAKRVTKRYHRFWALSEGRIHALAARHAPAKTRLLLRVPLWRWRRAASALATLALHRGPPPARMDAELRLCEFWGYFTTATGQASDDLAYRTTLK